LKRNADIGLFTRPSENEPKETAVSRFVLRVATSCGTRGNSLRSNSPRVFPARHVDARRGTKVKNLKPKKINTPPSGGLPEASSV
ncbi:MAG: hypothetical protein QNI88_13875, partial [Desulfobacterales bacterium]|nr:hypothetical protein [Desulfobacterales bacterium]